MSWIAITNYLAANWLEDAGVLTTLLGIWLTTRRLLICWPVVLISDVLYLIVFYRVQLYSDALLQIFFLAFTLYGWWYWWRGVRDEGEVRVVRLPTASLLIGLAAGAVGGIALGFVMKQIHGTALPFLDAMLTSYSLVASWWGARKHIANWWLWIAVDLIYIGEYIYKNLRLTAGLYALLVLLAVLGLRDWRRAPKAQTAV
ncbi:MAG TPA: nicotinamide riboside transporter PnuC [Terracidiphilus sp.]|jgi:nicotinamide mononucleotide transporter